MNILTYILQMNDKMSAPLNKVGVTSQNTANKVGGLKKEVQALNKAPLNGISNSFSGFFKTISPIVIITAGIIKLKQAIGQSETAYNKQAVSERQLATVMRNTMSATNDEINSILKLTSAQQKLGVIGDEVQLAGAQELSTYLTKTATLKKLIPVQNDMLAQQYGLNASQEQAAQIASMLGKVMDGQVGALSRYGYKFDEAQEKILKFGTEEQRAAVLAAVVSSAVGGMNKSLAESPEGAKQQRLNNMGDVLERIGRIVVMVKSVFSPVVDFFISGANKIADVFDRNESSILSFLSFLSGIVLQIFQSLGAMIMWVYSGYKTFMDGLRNGSPVFVAIAGVVVGLTTALLAYKTVTGIVSLATGIWTAAQWLLNVALTANPVGLVIAAIVALIAVIAFVILKTEGWGETWDNVIKFCSLVFDKFKTNLELKWLQIKDTFMSGLEVIERGWYKLQSLWNKDAANVGLAKLESQRNERAKEIANVKGKIDDLNKQIDDLDVWQVKMNDKSFSDIANGIKNKLGISAPGVPGTNGSGVAGTGGLMGGGTGSNAGKETANSIATGGSKTTHITINLRELVGSININKNGFRESAENMRDIVLDEMTRVLSMAQGQTI